MQTLVLESDCRPGTQTRMAWTTGESCQRCQVRSYERELPTSCAYCITASRHPTQYGYSCSFALCGADGNGRGGGGRRDDRGMGRGRRDDGVLAAIQQRRLQGIPEYLRSYVPHAVLLSCQPALFRK